MKLRFRGGVARPSVRWLWLTSLAVALVFAGIFARSRRDTPLGRLVSAIRKSGRVVEPRLSGGFPWAPLVEARGDSPESNGLALTAAAGQLLGETADDASSPGRRVAAAARLFSGRADAAIATLNAVPEASRGALTWNDLAAAHYVLASHSNSFEHLQEALVAVDEALRADPGFSEARFNRALILERYRLRDAAVDAWKSALAVETDSAWASESRRHLDALTHLPPTFAAQIELQYAGLERGERGVGDALVRLDAGDARYFCENDILGRWGEAWLHGDTVTADRHRIAARTLAASLVALNGDAMVAEAVAAIERADRKSLEKLARGHVAFREGRRLFRQERKPTEAEKQLSTAVQDFEGGGSPMALEARVYEGVAIWGQNRYAEAEPLFQKLDDTVPARYAALRAYVQWQLATCFMARAQWGRAIDLLTHAIDTYQGLQERANAAYLHDIVSQCYGIVGDRERASNHRLIALRELGKVTNYRLVHAISGMVYDATQEKAWRVAMSLLNIQIHAARRVGDKEQLTIALVRRALLDARFGDPSSAETDLREGTAVIASVEDSALRTKLESDRDATAALIVTRPEVAIPMLTRLLRFHESKGWRHYIPGLYLRRGRMERALGDRVRAASDFESGIAELEQNRERLPLGEQRWGVLDAADELFDEAIEASLDHDPQQAFAYAERERARAISDTLPEAGGAFDRRSLPPNAAIIEYSALPDKLLLFAVDRDGYRVAERAIGRVALSALIADFTENVKRGKRDARAYETLLAPVRDILATHRALIFVPDAETSLIPFAALGDERPLIETHAVFVSPSARFFVQARQRDDQRPRKTVLIVDNPASSEMRSLPFASREADAIEAEYAVTRRLSGPDATTKAFLAEAQACDVIHFAGHGVVSSDSAALMLASGRADAATLSRTRLSRSGIVVLAACDSARGPVRSAEGVLSVAHAFLQAGAPAVIATLWPISDEDAADFFPRLHRHLARGVTPAEAVRLAQLEFMRDPRNERSTLWAAVQSIGN